MPDRKALFDQLADAQRLVTQSEDRIRTQKAVVAALERDGLDSASAKDVLDAVIKSHERHVAARDQIREQLSFR
jgi:Spy/CpxP family protein refolding chaperone